MHGFTAGGVWVTVPMHHQLWNHTFTHSPPSRWAQWLGGAWVTVPMHHQLRKKNICRLESPMWNSMILDDFGIIRLSSPPSHWAQWLGGAWVTVPRHHQAAELSDGAEGFFQKSSSSVDGADGFFQKSSSPVGRDGADGFFQKSSSSVVTELTDFSKNRAAQSWRTWRIFPKIEQLSRDGADGFFQKSSGSSKMWKVSLFPLI